MWQEHGNTRAQPAVDATRASLRLSGMAGTGARRRAARSYVEEVSWKAQRKVRYLSVPLGLGVRTQLVVCNILPLLHTTVTTI